MSAEHVIRNFIAREILQDRPLDSLSRDTPLIDDHILDSMDIQRLVAFLEVHFGIRVTDDQLLPDNFATIAALASMVDALRART
jgi:acyl carrier protein